MGTVGKKIKSRLQIIADISQESGWSWVKTTWRVRQAKKSFGISGRRFLEERLYELQTDELANHRKRKNQNVRFVASKLDLEYEEAESAMDRARDEYGISYPEYVRQNIWKAETEKGRERRLKRFRQRELGFVNQVSYETGWSQETAEVKMKAAKERWPAITFRNYVAYNIHGKSDSEVENLVTKWNTAANKNRRLITQETGWSDREVRDHMIHCEVEFGLIPAYYMCYRAWELTDEHLATYATQRHSQRLSAYFNSGEDLAMARNKEQFDTVFSKFLKRKYWVNRPGSTFESFLGFVDGIEAIFCKLQQSGGGLGAFRRSLPKNRPDLESLFHELMDKPLLLVEEELRQHPDLEEFYPKSINTIRIVALYDGSRQHIISASAQFGHREVTDNFTNDGMVCAVDQHTGVIQTAAVDRQGQVYVNHPVSRKQFEGFQLPHWDLVLQTVREATAFRPGLNYVGWDLAILDNKISILEANTVPDPALYQAAFAPVKKGVRYLYDPFLELIQE